MIWFGLVLWHINHCSKSSIYIYIKYIWFGLVWFYGISTIVPNPLYTYTLNTYDLVWFGFMAYQPLWVISLFSVTLFVQLKIYIQLSLSVFYFWVEKNDSHILLSVQPKIDNISCFSILTTYCIILLKSMYSFYTSEILVDYFSSTKILFRFLSFQVSVVPLFKYQTVLFDPEMEPNQVLPLQARMDLWAMAM